MAIFSIDFTDELMKNVIKASLLLFFFQTSIELYSQEVKERSEIHTDAYRPIFHFSPSAHWMNDPNGLVYFNNTYHLFFQYYPGATVWGPMHWGHATSKDLIHWQELPIALYPDSLGMIFSGSAVIDKNNTSGFGANAMVAIFTYHNEEILKKAGKNPESQGIAFSLDEGKNWTKYNGNPVIRNAGERDFRDPKVCWNESAHQWNLVLAAGNIIKIFSSADLKNWKHESDFIPPVHEEFGVWECPDLFKIKCGTAEKWILITSQSSNALNGGSGTRYFVGDFDGKQFSNASAPRWLDYGKDFYAAVTFSNTPGEDPILLSWMSNWQYAASTPTNSWRSEMTLPRYLRLEKKMGEYYLTQRVDTAFVKSLGKVNSTAKQIDQYQGFSPLLSNAMVEFDLIKDPGQLNIVISNSLGEKYVIQYNGKRFTADRSNSGIVDFNKEFASKIQVLDMDEPLEKIQLILDHSSVELFINGGKYTMTNLLFPHEAYTQIFIHAESKASIEHLEIKGLYP